MSTEGREALKAVLFDADGVFQRAEVNVLERLTLALGGAADDRDACAAAFFAAETEALTGKANFHETLEPVLKRWRSAFDAQALHAMWCSTIETDNSILRLIGELRRAGIYCAIASNQEAHRARYMSQQLTYSLAFDAEFYSCHVGHAKPAAEYFDEIVRRAELDPARTLFIDDRAENVEAAKQAGLHAAHFVLGEVGQGAGAMQTLLAMYGLSV